MTIDHCLQAFQKDYAQNWNIFTQLYKGIPEMLTMLSEMGLKMAILSNKPQEDTERCAGKYLSHWKFEVIAGQRHAIPKKPDPSPACEIAKHFQLPPKEIIFLGDTSIDMKTATVAGMFPVGALWGFRTLAELQESGAKKIIEKPAGLLRLLHP